MTLTGMTYEYKVTYSGRSQEHLVKYDGSAETITCSCIKFRFAGILCSHALKVLEYKNVKRIPPHYILKRWTRDAKGWSITNYHGGQPNDNHKESVGKCYGHLCRNFREISSFTAEHEELIAYAHECSVELLKSLEQMKKNLCLDSTCVNQSSQGQALFDGNCENEQISMKMLQNIEITKPRGIKTKPIVGRPCSRLKGVLER